MRNIESGRAKMRIKESVEKKQGRIDLGRDVVEGVNKYWIDEDNRDDGDRNGYGNEGEEDVTEAVRIDNAAVRESQTRRLGEIKANRDENEVREFLDCLEMSATLSEYNNNDNNRINSSNNRNNGDINIGGRMREEISTSRGDYPHNLLRLSVEAAAVRCTFGEISYVLEKRWGRHVPSSPFLSGLYIASFCGGVGGGGNKGRGKKRDENGDIRKEHNDK